METRPRADLRTHDEWGRSATEQFRGTHAAEAVGAASRTARDSEPFEEILHDS